MCWDIAQKQDKLWIRWIHAYYIRGNSLETMPISQQASWTVRKVLETRDTMGQIQGMPKQNKSLIRQIYLNLIGTHPKVTLKHLICRNEARPKAKFTYGYIYGNMNTIEKLLKWGVHVEMYVCFLEFSQEHLFLECEYARRIWERLMQWLRRINNSSENGSQLQQWVLNNTKGKSMQVVVLKQTFTEYIYAIWTERNTRIFEKSARSTEYIAKEIACMCHVRASGKIRIVLQKLYF